MPTLTVGVLALQGGFSEHLVSLQKAAASLDGGAKEDFSFIEVRTPEELSTCDALVIPGGESTTLSLVAAQSGLLEPLRNFVKTSKKPTWGTCAGLIMLSEQASSTKRGGQELIGGLDVRVHRNHFGRQTESFVTNLDLPFLSSSSSSQANGSAGSAAPFQAVFIRAPVVDQILAEDSESIDEKMSNLSLPQAITKAGDPGDNPTKAKVEVLAVLEGRHASNKKAAVGDSQPVSPRGAGDIVALRQGNVFGLSFHPELTGDTRIHGWWLEQVMKGVVHGQ